MAEKKKVRIGLGTFDLIKGIAILSVVVIHALRFSPAGNSLAMNSPVSYLGSLFCGMMPMFFIISGYGFKKKPVIKTVKKTFSELVIPYLVAIPVAIFLHILLCKKIYPNLEYSLSVTKKQIISFLLGTDTAGPLWFFLAMFIANNVLNLILKVKKEWMQMVLVGLCVAAGFVVMHFEFRYFRIIEGLTAVGYCYIGYLLKEKKLLAKAMYSIWTYIVLIPMVLLQVWESGGAGFDMMRADYTVLSYVFAGCTGILLIFIGLFLEQLKWNWLDLIRKCGMYSYWILIVHTIDSIAFPWYEMWVELESAYLAVPIMLGLRVIVILVGCAIMKKITHMKYQHKMTRSLVKN